MELQVWCKIRFASTVEMRLTSLGSVLTPLAATRAVGRVGLRRVTDEILPRIAIALKLRSVGKANRVMLRSATTVVELVIGQAFVPPS